MVTALGPRRLNGDSWVALGLIAANAVFLGDLLADPPQGAYVKTTSLPVALSVALIGLSLVLLGWSLRRPSETPRQAETPGSNTGSLAPLMRVAIVVAQTVVYIAALPWLGYLLASSIFFGGLSLVYGNRKPLSILVVMVSVPLVLMLFFEKFMIVLLPSARLFE